MKRVLLLSLCVGVSLLLAQQAEAKTYHVDYTDSHPDPVSLDADPDPLDAVNNTCAAEEDGGGECSLREAITLANDDEVNCDHHFYIPSEKITLTQRNFNMDDWNNADDLDLRNDTCTYYFIGSGQHDTVIDGNSQYYQTYGQEFSIFDNVINSVTVELRDVTLTNTNVPALDLIQTHYTLDHVTIDSINDVGIRNSSGSNLTIQNSLIQNSVGGLYNRYGSVHVINSIIKHNSTLSEGAGLANELGGHMIIDNSIIEDNEVTDTGYSHAGGIMNSLNSTMVVNDSIIRSNSTNAEWGKGGGLYSGGNLIVNNSKFYDNQSLGSTGGGVAIGPLGQAEINNSLIYNNYAGYTGGGLSNSEEVSLSYTRIFDNTAELGGGGVLNSGTMTMDTIAVVGNIALGQNDLCPGHSINSVGGGIFNAADGVLSIENSIVAKNHVYSDDPNYGYGGGLNNWGEVEILNSTFYRNRAHINNGGAIYNTGGSVKLSHSTLMRNKGQHVGGIGTYNGSFEIKNSIVSENLDQHNATYNCSGVMTSYGYNIDDEGSCNLNGNFDQVVDPQLDPSGLQKNGGFTKTVAIAHFSPAQNNGSCYDIDGVAVDYDQRGKIRNGSCDIGAFELQINEGIEPGPMF